MSGFPWFRLFPSEFLAGTRALTPAETGIYATLLATMMDRGEPLDRDVHRLARQCGSPSGSAFEKALEALEKAGLIEIRSDGRIWSAAAEAECRHRAGRSANGVEAAKARWGKKDKKNNGTQVPAHTPDLDLETDTDSHPLPPVSAEEDFRNQIWLKWPEKDLPDKRGAAENYFGKLTELDQRRAIDATPTYLQAMAGRKEQALMILFLKDRLFEEFYDAPEIGDGGLFKVTLERREWEPWLANIRERFGDAGVATISKEGFYLTDRRWPVSAMPARQLAAKR